MNNKRSAASAAKWVVLIGIIVTCTSRGVAQSAPSSVDGAVAVAQQAYIQGRALFSQGQFDRGEAVLEAQNRQPIGTAHWSMESALGLARMAYDLRADGNGPQAIEAGKRALSQLTLAVQRSGGAAAAADMANAYEMTGDLDANLMGNRAGAETSYARAIQLAPESGSAALKLARLRAENANAQKGN